MRLPPFILVFMLMISLLRFCLGSLIAETYLVKLLFLFWEMQSHSRVLALWLYSISTLLSCESRDFSCRKTIAKKKPSILERAKKDLRVVVSGVHRSGWESTGREVAKLLQLLLKIISIKY